MAHIRRQRTNKRTTEKFITERAPVEVRSSTHSPETGELLHLTFKLAEAGSPELGDPETWYITTLTRKDVEVLWDYVMAAEAHQATERELRNHGMLLGMKLL